MFALACRIYVCIFLITTNAVAFAADSQSPVSTKHRALDGLRFEGTTGEIGKGDDHHDEITFEDGQFRSLDCENWGFGAAPYTVEKDGNSYHFSATLVSDNRGVLEWKGTVTGDTATGTFRWLHERWYWTIDRQYWFKGTRSAKP
jgi:hypothetical protein